MRRGRERGVQVEEHAERRGRGMSLSSNSREAVGVGSELEFTTRITLTL